MPIKVFGCLPEEKAFTLIEVIVCLLLAGIMAALVGFGFVHVTEGYFFAKQNSETVQKAQIAMTRIVKELGAAESQNSTAAAITAASAMTVTYTRLATRGSSTFISNTISIADGLVQMSGSSIGTLINNVVTAFSSFSYFDAAGNPLATPVTAPAKIRRIDVTLRVSDANNISSEFNNSVWINESY